MYGPAPVHDAERRVAFGNRGHHHAHGAHVEQLLEGQLLALHLAVDAVDVFRPAVDLSGDAGRAQLLAQRGAQRVDVVLAVGAPLVERGGHAAVLIGLEVAEGQILELPLQLPDAEAIGERCVHGARLERPPLALRGAAARVRAAA